MPGKIFCAAMAALFAVWGHVFLTENHVGPGITLMLLATGFGMAVLIDLTASIGLWFEDRARRHKF